LRHDGSRLAVIELVNTEILRLRSESHLHCKTL
jgi:hypothetical protein